MSEDPQAVEDGFAAMVDAAGRFFPELAANNSREWFEPRKARYVEEVRRPAEALARVFEGELHRLTGEPHAGKVYRVNRDVRFSREKHPYNAHLHVLWRPADAERAPGWFFGLSPAYMIVAAGSMGFEDGALDRWRALVDAKGARLARAIAEAHAAVGAGIAEWGPEPLKRVPKPYPADHPHADLLKRKALILSAPVPPGWRETGLVPTLAGACAALLPPWRLLRAAVS